MEFWNFPDYSVSVFILPLYLGVHVLCVQDFGADTIHMYSTLHFVNSIITMLKFHLLNPGRLSIKHVSILYIYIAITIFWYLYFDYIMSIDSASMKIVVYFIWACQTNHIFIYYLYMCFIAIHRCRGDNKDSDYLSFKTQL